MTSPRYNSVRDRLVAANPRLRRTGFRKEVCAALYRSDMHGWGECTESEALAYIADEMQIHVVPPLYEIDEEKRCVHVYQIVPAVMQEMQFRKMVELWFDFDSESWFMELHVYSKHGKLMGHYTDEDLSAEWTDKLYRDVKERRVRGHLQRKERSENDDDDEGDV